MGVIRINYDSVRSARNSQETNRKMEEAIKDTENLENIDKQYY